MGGHQDAAGWGSLSEEEIQKALDDDMEPLPEPQNILKDRRIGWSLSVNGQMQRCFSEKEGEIEQLAPQVIAQYVLDNPCTFTIEWRVVETYLIQRSSYDSLRAEVYDHQDEEGVRRPPAFDVIRPPLPVVDTD